MERTTACAAVLVDDEDAGRGAMARMLIVCGCRVADFATAAAALVHLTIHGADLLVTDLEMPEMDGAALIAAVQARGLVRRIVLISGRGEDHCHARLALVGARPLDAVASKPISLAALREFVGGWRSAPG